MKDGVPLEAERGGLIVVAREDRIDRLGIGFEVALGAVDIDARVRPAVQRCAAPSAWS